MDCDCFSVSVLAWYLLALTLSANGTSIFLEASGGPKPMVCRRVEEISRSDPEEFLAQMMVPSPHRIYCDWNNGQVCNTEEFERNNGAIYLGQDMDLDDDSFSIFAHIRLRPRDDMDNWGGRILSKRTSYKTGWQFVVPSFYTRSISMYMNDEPGHITFGESRIPDMTWVTVGVTVDRDTFRRQNLATVQAYYNGQPDGTPYILYMNTTLSSDAPLTIGHWMYEDNTFHSGRKDWRSPKRRKHVHRFFGDIRDLTVWKTALSANHMQRYSDATISKWIGNKQPCAPTWRSFGCKCYKVFPTPLNFDSAWRNCEEEGGRLVVIDEMPIQQFVWTLVVTSSDQDYWIGLNDTVHENVWKFSSGVDLNYFIGQWNNFPDKIPDKEYKTDDCAELRKLYAGKWNDANCNKYNPYICERDPAFCP